MTFDDSLRALLLSHEGLLTLDAPEHGPSGDLNALELELISYGWTLSAQLHAALAVQSREQLERVRVLLVDVARAEVGAHVDHVPLTDGRRDPRAGDKDDMAAAPSLRDRVRAWLQSGPQPCASCSDGLVYVPVEPCGHLACPECRAPHGLACPVCRQDAEAPAAAGPSAGAPRRRLRVIDLCSDGLQAARQLLERLATRRTPLSPGDRQSASALLGALGDTLEMLPAQLGARETMAMMLSQVIAARPHDAHVALERHTSSATDVLRVACTLMGGDGSLLAAPPARGRSLTRTVRRALLDQLQTFDVDVLCEQVMSRAELWKAVARGLHPFEKPARHPRVTLAFALLRGEHAHGRLGAAMACALAEAATVQAGSDGQLTHNPHAAQLEAALTVADVPRALELLAAHPGQLLRRADHLLRLSAGDDRARTCAALIDAAAHAPSPLLLTVLAHLRHRTAPHARRLAQPKGSLASTWGYDDNRDPLDGEIVGPVVTALELELAERAGRRGALDGMLIDRAVADVPAPLAERAGSQSLLTLPRGAAMSLPADDDRPLRLFLHWTEPAAERIDLDLSVGLFAEDGRSLGICDYTYLDWGSGAARHSGDLTSAPAPLGATEYVDLDVAALRRQNVHHLVMVVFSFSGQAFEDMTDCFAGVMHAPESSGFDPRAVLQRVDLHGQARVSVPLTFDLERRQLRWVDLNLSASGHSHSIRSYERTLGPLVADLQHAFAARPTMFDVALAHGAGRAQTVELRDRDGASVTLTRAAGESLAAWMDRLRSGQGAQADVGAVREGRWLAATVHGTAGLPADAQVWALAGDAGDALQAVGAADLVDGLAR